ncbi:hypothetical protein ACMG5I_24940, partial [Escherichia coli]
TSKTPSYTKSVSWQHHRNYYSFQHPHEGSNQIPLFIRPRTYGNNVSSGQIMSRVKIVVMYN